ncbi:MAG: signal peptidase II [Myxococcota bacterium]|nr:signal peptidase II [Myxococcota bacterium]MDW8363582.1 signal peptidase II [Myxococcales bacterium]
MKKRPVAVAAPAPRSRRAIVMCAVATVVLLAADLGTKAWAVETLSRPPATDPGPVCDNPPRWTQRDRGPVVGVIDGFLEFRYAENCGAAFGLGSDGPFLLRRLLFIAAALLASVVLLVMFVRGRGGPLFAASVPLVVSGALGNLVDRVRYGYVVDFIRIYDLPNPFGERWAWPTFNVADCGITVGVILLVIDGFLEPRAQAAGASRAPAPGKAG